MKLVKDKVFIKLAASLAIPIILQDMLNSSVNMADTFMIGQLGDNEVAAVGLANQIFFIYQLILFGITSGSAIFIGQYWGKRDKDNIHKVMGISITLSLVFALIFSVGAFLIPEKIMSLYSQDSTVITLGCDYLSIILISYFFSAVILTINSALRATGCPKLPMCTTCISLLLNVIFNYILIFKLNLGVKGAALGTVFARAIEVTCQIFFMYKLKTPVAAKITHYFKADKTFLVNFFKITIPVILNEFMWALGTSIYNMAYKYSGTEAQAAVQISSTVQNLFIVMGTGAGFACSIMISNALGAGDIKKAKSYSKKFIKLSVTLSSLMGLVLILSTNFILSFFDVTEIVKDYAYYLFLVTAFGIVLKTYNYTTIIGILRSGGDTKFCLLIDAATVWFIGIPFAFLGSAFLGLPIYITLALVYMEEVVKFFLSTQRVLTYKWAKSIID